MVMGRDGATTALVHWDQAHWRLVPDFTLPDGRRLIPYSARNNLLAHGVVRLAMGPEEYGDEAELVEGVRRFIHRYVDVSPSFERIAAHYVRLTWIYDAFNELPYLRVRGEPGTGKTRFLLTVGSLCYKPIFASGASTVSPLFRIMDAMGGTLVIDESDFRVSDEKAEVVKILNNGNVRGFPVLRTEQVQGSKEFNPRAYSVFGPKIVATRGFFDDRALETRFLSEAMSTERLRDDIPISLPKEHEEEALALRNKLLLFRFRNLRKPRDLQNSNRELSPRLRQVFAPLLSVVADEESKRAMVDLARGYEAELAVDRSMELEALLLAAIHELLHEAGRAPSLQDVTERFLLRHGTEYPDVTVRRVGWILRKRLGVVTAKSHGIYVIGADEHPKLARLFERYGVGSTSDERVLESSPQSPQSPPSVV